MKTEYKKSNGGYSLVELIVTVLIMSMVVGIIGIIIATSRNNYEVITTDSTLQTEAQVASNHVHELMLGSVDSGAFDGVDVTELQTLAPGETPLLTGTADILWIKDLRGYHFVVREDATQILRCCEVLDAAGVQELDEGADPLRTKVINAVKAAGVVGDPYSMLAEYVKEITYTREASSRLAKITMKLEYNSKEYSTTISVAGRNTIS